MHEDVFGPDHDAFRATVRRFVAAEITPHAFAWEEAEAFPDALFAAAAAAGILGPSMPADLGGGGGDVLHNVVAAEELVRGGSGGVAAGLGSLEIALPPILALGTAAQRERFVRPVLAGARIAALAITEPGTGSDVAGVRTRAVRDGDGWRIDGHKTFITSGVRAHQVTVLARTGPDPHQGLTFFVVDRDTPGYGVSRALKKTGWRASDTAELVFDGVRVPDDHRIGPEGSGFLALMQNFANERLLLAAQGVATAALAVEEAIAWAKQREAFGRPLAKLQVIRHKIADMHATTAAARATLYATARAARDGRASPLDVAACKNVCTDAAVSVTYEAVQILGGMGYMREHVVERLSRDARLLPIGGGTREIMNEIAARLLLA